MQDAADPIMSAEPVVGEDRSDVELRIVAGDVEWLRARWHSIAATGRQALRDLGRAEKVAKAYERSLESDAV